MLDVDEFIYVFSEMSNQPAEKLILILHPIFLRKWNVFMLHTSSHTTDCNILLTFLQLQSYNTSI